jgi:[protein-PII] uridylyltransferase
MNRPFEELVALAISPDAAHNTLTRDECLLATRQYAAQHRDALRQQHADGASGSNIVHLLSDVADEIVRGIYHFALASLGLHRAVQSRVALCALGGYGRGELSPFSDLDISLLYEGPLDEHIRAINSFLIPFFWDSGFVVGYSIHSIQEANELASDDILTFTRFLESRHLAGDSMVFARLKMFIRELQSGPLAEKFIEQKVRDRYDTLNAEYHDLYAPEPNVKENAGGLRDFHTALWLLMMSHGITTLDEAVAQGIITQDEHLSLIDAIDLMWRIRNEMHFCAGRADDRLTYKNQIHIAAAFGYMPGPSVRRFMQDYYTTAGKLRRFMRIATRACSPNSVIALPDSGMPIAQDYVTENGELYVGVGDNKWFYHSPTRLMEIFWICARHKVPLSHTVERMITGSLELVNDAFRESDVVRRFFLAICNKPLEAGNTLRQAASLGLLGRYIPEFADVDNVIRYADFHSYPVGEHTLRAIEALANVDKVPGAVGRCLREALENFSDPYILVLAILFHDLGKVQGDVHVEESVKLTRQICARMGIEEGDTERIAFLVQHHILMTTISQYRDIDDEDIVESFAKTMQNEYRLRALFLLSYADLTAVAPGVWNEWKGALLVQLYLRTVKRLLGRAETSGEEYWKSPKADEVRQAAPPEFRHQVDAHLQGLNQRYFVAFQPGQIVQHMECIAEAEDRGLAIRCETNPVTQKSEIVICTRDRHALFSMIAGCFSSQLIDISGAALFTRQDGWVIDWFSVSDARLLRPLTGTMLQKLEQVLYAVLIQGEDVQEHVDRGMRRLFALLQPRVAVPTRIVFDNYSSKYHTVVDIETGDRTGLLYDITRIMSELGLDISTARIVTDVQRVRDSFYITKDGCKVTDEEVLAAIRDAIHHAIHPRAVAETKGG